MMKKRTGAAAALPTALVASTARRRSRSRRGRKRLPGLESLSALSEPLRAVPEAVERALPRSRRSGLGRLRKRRRKPNLMRLARHAGTAVSAVGIAADLLNQINAISEATDRPARHGGSGEDRRPEKRTGRQPEGSRTAAKKPGGSAQRAGGSAQRAGSPGRNGARRPAEATSAARRSDNHTDKEI